ncbi:MAG TPA: O-antigen ligase family protein, partial [Thermoanaerobaculia bacterium]|nr:O-antigen ligase family protein [Thermoanaerobaculia bacterium]
FIYAIASTISALTADRAMHSFGESALWIKLTLFPLALMLFREIPRSRVLLLRTFLFFGVFIAAMGLAQYALLDHRDLEHRITGPTAHVMTFSGLLLALSLLYFVLTLYYRRPWLIAGTAVITLTLLLTFTRSVWIGWIAAVTILILLIRVRWIAYAAPLFVLFITFMPLSLFSRLVSTFNLKQSSNLDRVRMVQAGVEIIKDYPLLGVGPANIVEVYPFYRSHDAPRFKIPHLHDNPVQIWAERGIVALIAYFMLIILFLRECGRAWRGPRREFAQAGVAIAVGLTYAGLFEFNFGDTEVLLCLINLFALVIAFIEPPLPNPAYPSVNDSADLFGPAGSHPIPANELPAGVVRSGEKGEPAVSGASPSAWPGPVFPASPHTDTAP